MQVYKKSEIKEIRFRPVIGCLLPILYGVFAGMFVGCLPLATAEMLDNIQIFARRIGFRNGLGVDVMAMAWPLGKC